MLQRGLQLTADVGRILRISHTVGFAVKATDTSVPVINQLAALERIHAFPSLGEEGRAKGSFGLVRAGPQDEVRRRTWLARAEECAGSALHDLDALDRVVHAHQGAGF